MRILFTGASSFTGFWFVRALANAGHEVVAIFRQGTEAYQGVRRDRVLGLAKACRSVQCSFGDAEFLALAAAGPWDLFCHHAADVTNYKSPDFNVAAALENNTRNAAAVLKALAAAGCPAMVLTGSVFESDEGAGEQPLRAFSPYGLSKALTFQMFRHYAGSAGLALGKFVIPNPFGPLEDPRFTTYLAKTWHEGKTPAVATPAYVRDNIHVSLLALEYVKFAQAVAKSRGPVLLRRNPSGYVETQGAFAERVAKEMHRRLNLPCPLELRLQADFPEPKVRINTDLPDALALGWDESRAWDELAENYSKIFSPTPR
ncbi:MAG: NAD(P)-dependent oxidoreductase [Planctomycetota bacterium]|nr:NAD(P)-dependent oxidoreductase [Planctomycetota bacterium]